MQPAEQRPCFLELAALRRLAEGLARDPLLQEHATVPEENGRKSCGQLATQLLLLARGRVAV
jgi:hypothetical protein